jgi:hypothetical protein
VKSYALSIAAEPDHMAQTLSQIKADLMGTAAGVEIKQLRAAARSGKVKSVTEIQKSPEYSDAWMVLSKWEASMK